MDQATFVRTQMLLPEPPPVSERGMVKWGRENLFAGPLNTILTVVSIAVIVWLAVAAAPWLLHSVWTADNLSECRSIIAATWGEGATGACWAVIRERWTQFIYGFYPQHLYWRPNLAFILLFVALAPVLFSQLPRALLAISLAYPALAYWLLWGGSVWEPVNFLIAVAVGVAVAVLYPRIRSDLLNLLFAAVVALAVGAVASVVFGYGDAMTTDFLARMQAVDFWPGFLEQRGLFLWIVGAVGSALAWVLMAVIWLLLWAIRAVTWVLTLGLGDIAAFRYSEYFTIGAALAFVGILAAGRRRAPVIGILGGFVAGGAWLVLAGPDMVRILHGILPWSIDSVRSDRFGGFLLSVIIGVTGISLSLPLGILLALGRKSDLFLIKTFAVIFIEFIRGVPLITLLFVASLLLNYFLPPGTNFDIILRVVIMVTLFAAAYIAEVIRGGLAALPKGQQEAADALGLNYWQAQRLIILPQALKISIPGIVSTFIGLFKDTTLVVFVGLLDPLKGITDSVRAHTDWKGIYWEPYIFVGVLFFIFCFGMSRYSMYLERKLKTDHR